MGVTIAIFQAEGTADCVMDRLIWCVIGGDNEVLLSFRKFVSSLCTSLALEHFRLSIILDTFDSDIVSITNIG